MAREPPHNVRELVMKQQPQPQPQPLTELVNPGEELHAEAAVEASLRQLESAAVPIPAPVCNSLCKLLPELNADALAGVMRVLQPAFGPAHVQRLAAGLLERARGVPDVEDALLALLFDGISDRASEVRLATLRLVSAWAPSAGSLRQQRMHGAIEPLRLLLQDHDARVRREARVLLLRWYKYKPTLLNTVVQRLEGPDRNALKRQMRETPLDSMPLARLLENVLRMPADSPPPPPPPPPRHKATTLPLGSDHRDHDDDDDQEWMLKQILDLRSGVLTPAMLEFLRLESTCALLLRFITRCPNPNPPPDDDANAHQALRRSYRAMQLLTGQVRASQLFIEEHAEKIVVQMLSEGLDASSANIFHVCALLSNILTQYPASFASAILSATPSSTFDTLFGRICETPVCELLLGMLCTPELVDVLQRCKLMSRALSLAMETPDASVAESTTIFLILALRNLLRQPHGHLLVNRSVPEIVLSSLSLDSVPTWRRRLAVRLLLLCCELLESINDADSKTDAIAPSSLCNVPERGDNDNDDNDDEGEVAPEAPDGPSPGYSCIDLEAWRPLTTAFCQALLAGLPTIFAALATFDNDTDAQDSLRLNAYKVEHRFGVARLSLLELLSKVVAFASASDATVPLIRSIARPLSANVRRWTLSYRHNTMVLLQLRRILFAFLESSDAGLAEDLFLDDGFLRELLDVYEGDEPRSTLHSVVRDLAESIVRIDAEGGRLGRRLQQFVRDDATLHELAVRRTADDTDDGGDGDDDDDDART